jgi:hypothetical protein
MPAGAHAEGSAANRQNCDLSSFDKLDEKMVLLHHVVVQIGPTWRHP